MMINQLLFLLTFLVFQKGLSQNVDYIQVSSFYDTCTYSFIDHYIDEIKKTNSQLDTITVVFGNIGIQQYQASQDYIYSFELCNESRTIIDRTSKKGIDFGGIQSGTHLSLLIRKQSDTLNYVDQICQKISGKHLYLLCGSLDFYNFPELHDTIFKYCKMDRYLEDLYRYKFSNHEHFSENEVVKILKQYSSENHKFIYVTDLWLGNQIDDANIVCLIPRHITSYYPYIRKRMNRLKGIAYNDSFVEITMSNIPKWVKPYGESTFKIKRDEYTNARLFVYYQSLPCRITSTNDW